MHEPGRFRTKQSIDVEQFPHSATEAYKVKAARLSDRRGHNLTLRPSLAKRRFAARRGQAAASIE